jgi:hypothetical protein
MERYVAWFNWQGEPMPPRSFFHRNSYGYMVSDRRAVKAIKLLYHGCTIALDRKLRKALDMIDEYKQAKP